MFGVVDRFLLLCLLPAASFSLFSQTAQIFAITLIIIIMTVTDGYGSSQQHEKVRRLALDARKAKSIRFILHLGLNVNFRQHFGCTPNFIFNNIAEHAEEVKIKCEPKICLAERNAESVNVDKIHCIHDAAAGLVASSVLLLNAARS